MHQLKDIRPLTNQRPTRPTAYATVLDEGGFEATIDGGESTGKTIQVVVQKIFVHDNRQEAIRIGYTVQGKLVPRPLVISEENLPALLDGAAKAGILSKQTVKNIVQALLSYQEN
ncbi:MAG: hypothetical protein ACM3TR_19925 [Caulobacteraceae bacterium]